MVPVNKSKQEHVHICKCYCRQKSRIISLLLTSGYKNWQQKQTNYSIYEVDALYLTSELCYGNFIVSILSEINANTIINSYLDCNCCERHQNDKPNHNLLSN